jgi:2-polyprenyl-3-methyl-5-hydroxy-6-metoxy-1,4-benzoquinol methylase
MCVNLICPKTRSKLKRSGDVFVSPEGQEYPIINGVPRFVEEDNYSNSFGEQWNTYLTTQLDSYNGKKISEDRIAGSLGPDLWCNIEGKTVLEGGCGAGRFTEILLNQKTDLYSIDFSSAADANVKNFPITDKHKVFQADILNLPFQEESFDLVLCLGVIQHTPNPTETIAALYRQVKPGGFIIVDHYKYLLSWYLHPAPLFRFFLKRYGRKSPKGCMNFVRAIVNMMFPVHWFLWNTHPRLNWLINRISPVITYFDTFPELNKEQQKEWSLLDTHDSLTDWFKHRKTVKQIRCILEDLGVVNVECRYGGNGIEAKGQKPKQDI